MKMFAFYLLLLLFFPNLVQSNDNAYQHIRDKVFWPELYSISYKTLYCGRNKEPGEKVTVEHVYPASWIAKAYGCRNRKQCNNIKYKQASADLHNLWPALKRYNSSRGNQAFGEIEGNKPRFKQDNCDFERSSGKNAVVEPRDNVKGEIARSFLYMIKKYNLPDHGLHSLMVKWDRADLPDKEEVRRDLIIKRLQGETNPFIKPLVKPFIK